MTIKRLPIRTKIMILTLGIVLYAILIGGVVIIGKILDIQEEELGKRAMITSRTVAQLPEVKKYIQVNKGWNEIEPVVEKIRVINEADYVVVMDMDHIRYSHPVKDMIGTVSKGSDEGAAFADHTFISKAKGEMGTAVKAFVPIKNDELEQIGVVVVGHVIPGYYEVFHDLTDEMTLILLLVLLFGVIGSYLLARHLKQQMFYLEPHEIVRMFEERTATFHSMHEGVIAIDNQEHITIFNDKAKSIFSVSGDVVGRQIREVIPDTRLPEIIELSRPVYNQEIRVSGKVIMSNRVPIKVKDQIVGAVAIFQDRTEVAKMAEELTGVKAFVEALRVQNHEHMNKLHTIAGLLQLGNMKKAMQYVFQISEEKGSLTRFLNQRIKNESLAGLLLSKVGRGKELGIKVVIDNESLLKTFPDQLDQHDFVTIIGNLIENAYDALKGMRDGRIDVSIAQDSEICAILVEDNGCGMSQEVQQHMFERGYTTKGNNGSGIGLYLIRQIVEKGNGEIEVTSHANQGTSFVIVFPMNGRGEEDEGDKGSID
ncbi:ATP-binding protein [Fictibacillus phosphorivorans]|uniref:ATP-binding protein n=1 Tax=Fictibacillus phosphorivorans TaxID=1221500 RepID=UPI003CE8EB40